MSTPSQQTQSPQNGNPFIEEAGALNALPLDASTPPDERVVASIVGQVLAALRPGALFSSTLPTASNARASELDPLGVDGSPEKVFAELSRRSPGSTDNPGAFQNRMTETNANAAEVAFYGAAFQSLMTRSGVATTTPRMMTATAVAGDPIVRTYWWGFHVEISHATIQEFVSSTNPFSVILDTIARAFQRSIPAWVGPVVGFIYTVLQVLAQAVDRGRGIYLSMSWFAPGIFIPTTVV